MLTRKNNSVHGKATQTPSLLQAFNRVKDKVAEQVLPTFLGPNKIIDIYSDANDDQLGAVITQEGKVIAFCSRKLTAC